MSGVNHIDSASLWLKAVLGPDGKIYCVPHQAGEILVFDPQTLQVNFVDVSEYADSADGDTFWWGVAKTDDAIYFIPHS